MQIRPAKPEDAEAWEKMRDALWPSRPGEHAAEIAGFFATGWVLPTQCFIAFDAAGKAAGFVEISIRPYAEGCHSGNVAFIEGWYVAPQWRRKHVGRQLVETAEAWALEQACTELASDTELDNDVSAVAHMALGFEEVNRSINFRKSLQSGKNSTRNEA